MKRLTKLLLMLSLLCSLPQSLAAKRIQYGNPAGNRFPIVAWYDFPNADQITTKRFEDLQNAGYTHIVSNLRGEANYRKAFDAMKNTDIKVILSGIEPEETFINKWKSEPRISQWYMRDEPVEGLFEECGIKKSEFEALDTTRLVFVNLLPSYADRMSLDGSYYDYLLRAADIMQLSFISYDHYPFYEKYEMVQAADNTYTHKWVKHERETFYSDLQDAMDVCNLRHIPFWAFCMSSAHRGKDWTVDRYPVPTAAELRLEAYSALAYGAQGLEYYRIGAVNGGNIYTDPPVDYEGNTNYVWEYVKSINLRIQNLAAVFLGNKVIDVWHKTVVPEGLDSFDTPPAPFSKIEGSSSKGLIVSHFINDNRHYLMVLSKDLEKSQTVNVLRSSTVKRVNEDGVIVRDNHSVFTLAPAEFLLFTWI